MLRDITIGQYYNAESVIHRLDPRVKMFWVFLQIVFLFVFDNIISLIISGIVTCIIIKLSDIPVKYIIRGIKSIIFILLITSAINIFFTPGQVLFRLYFLRITRQGIIKSVIIFFRISMIVLISSMLTFTTTPTNITDGLEKAFSPLRKIRVPVNDIAMMMSIALRFIPVLQTETDKIIKAQTARGADFENGNFVVRIKKMIPIIITLFVSSIKRATELATAMDARCYGIYEDRTKLHPLHYKRNDYVAMIILLLFTLVMVTIKALYVIKIL